MGVTYVLGGRRPTDSRELNEVQAAGEIESRCSRAGAGDAVGVSRPVPITEVARGRARDPARWLVVGRERAAAAG